MSTQPLAQPALDPLAYDRVVVAFSGGKDSLACLLHVLDCGVPVDRIEVWHHDVDGGVSFVDWPVTASYCAAICAELGVRLLTSYREGGFRRELERNGTPTAPVRWERLDGKLGTAGGKGPRGTRGLFPQVSANLAVRWCSAYLKIDVARRVLANEERFLAGRTLFVTGERAEESVNRSRYAVVERHAAASARRDITHWRPVHAWTEAQVWQVIERHRIAPHPAYVAGFGRVSCMACIFGSRDQWATVAALAPERFEAVAVVEAASGKTIQRTASVRQLAAAGTAYPASAEHGAAAVAVSFAGPVRLDIWSLPAGAYGESCGPV